MTDGLLFPISVQEGVLARGWPKWVTVHRRGPLLRPARSGSPEGGVFGLDLTAGCALGCPFCHVRAMPWYPGDDRVLFDPSLSRRLGWTLDGMDPLPRLVVLSPASEPFPAYREVRREAERVVQLLLEREVAVSILTRGRIPARLIGVLAQNASRVNVAIALMTTDRRLSRALEPRCAPPQARLGRIARLMEAGVPVEVRLEPMIAGLTDTRENIGPLFEALARLGVRRVVAHYLFLQPAMVPSLRSALQPLGLAEKLEDNYKNGPVFSIGSIGATKHLPLDVRQAGLASLAVWGAEHGLEIETGAAQNPDLPRVEPAPPQPSRPVTWPLHRPSSSLPTVETMA